MSHTPALPFKAIRDPAFSGRTPVMALLNEHGDCVASGFDPEEIEFVIQACNSHYELLEALKSVLIDATFSHKEVLYKCQNIIAKAESK